MIIFLSSEKIPLRHFKRFWNENSQTEVAEQTIYTYLLYGQRAAHNLILDFQRQWMSFSMSRVLCDSSASTSTAAIFLFFKSNERIYFGFYKCIFIFSTFRSDFFCRCIVSAAECSKLDSVYVYLFIEISFLVSEFKSFFFFYFFGYKERP